MCADIINSKYRNYSLLDVGCRTMDLKPMLDTCSQYFGADIIPGDDIFEADLEKGLPFDDNSFDIITALDVLEHLNNPHQLMSELLRVARKGVIISLPNMFYIQFRWNFLIGTGVSDKYRFSPYPLIDRHKWLLSYDEAVNFIKMNSKSFSVDYKNITPVRNRTKLISCPIERSLAIWKPNLFAYGLMTEIMISDNLD
jgi:SAM-dependent methyltransferase